MTPEVAQTDFAHSLVMRMLQHNQVICPLFHHFNDGVYVREIHVKQGTLIVGHKHKFKHLSVLLEGSMDLLDNNAHTTLEGPVFFISEPGRKIFLALTDLKFANILPTVETDIAKIEEFFIEPDNEELYALQSYYEHLIEEHKICLS